MSTNSRHTNTDTEMTSPIVAALLRIETSGRSPARRSSVTTSLRAAEIMKSRPGQVFSSSSRAEYGSSVARAGAGRRLPGSARSGTLGVFIALAAMITDGRLVTCRGGDQDGDDRVKTHEASRSRALLDGLHPCRTGAGSVDRRHHHTDLSDLHLRPGSRWPS